MIRKREKRCYGKWRESACKLTDFPGSCQLRPLSWANFRRFFSLNRVEFLHINGLTLDITERVHSNGGVGRTFRERPPGGGLL